MMLSAGCRGRGANSTTWRNAYFGRREESLGLCPSQILYMYLSADVHVHAHVFEIRRRVYIISLPTTLPLPFIHPLPILQSSFLPPAHLSATRPIRPSHPPA